MSTTTIRISGDLKARIAAVAKEANQTSHAFIVETLADATEAAETQAALRRLANERWATLEQTGKSVPWDEAKTWLRSRAAGQQPEKPKARLPADRR